MSIYRFGPFSLDSRRLVLSLGDAPVAAGPTVVKTLLALVERPRQTLTKAELLDRIWPQGFVEEGNLAQNVCVLRKILRAHWQDVIQTVPRCGYCFASDVQLSESSVTERLSGARFYYAAAAAALALVFSFAMLHEPARSLPASQRLSPAGARAYAMGNYYWKLRTRPGLDKSVRYFEAVIKTDPQSAHGYAALAEAYAMQGDYGYGSLGRSRSYARARVLAHRALAIDQSSAEAHAALGIAEDDLPRMRQDAEAQYVRAIALDPAYALAHQWYGAALLQQGRTRAAYRQLRIAAQLDPVAPAALSWLSEAAYYSRDYPQAIDYARQALELSPERVDTWVGMGMAYEAAGKFEAAQAAYRAVAARCKTCAASVAALLAHAQAHAGDYSGARRELAIAEQGRGMQRAEAPDLAAALVALGRTGPALDVIRQIARDIGEYPILALDPRWDPVRHDPRFSRYLTVST